MCAIQILQFTPDSGSVHDIFIVRSRNSRSNFGPNMCAMFKYLRAIDPGMITTLTPWGQRWSMYSQLGACKVLIFCISFSNSPEFIE